MKSDSTEKLHEAYKQRINTEKLAITKRQMVFEKQLSDCSSSSSEEPFAFDLEDKEKKTRIKKRKVDAANL